MLLNTRVGKCVPDIEVGKSTMARDYRCAHLSGLVGWGDLSSQEASRHRGFSVFAIPCASVVSGFSRFSIVSRGVSGGFRVRFVPGVCVSFSSSWKSAWVVFVCANFVRMQFPVKVSACFVVLPAWGSEYVLSAVSVSRILWGFVVRVCSGSRWNVRRICGLYRFNPLCREYGFLCVFFRLI